MNALLAALGDPQRAFPAVHVVGTNGKSTATLTIEQMLLADGLSVGSTISPHIRDWSERLRIDGAPGDLVAALRRVRPDAERIGATQFETMTAAALWAFADAGVDVAVVEAGLGGRFDATNVLRSRVVLLTNVGLEHTDVLGETVEEIAAEKLAVVHTDDTVVVLPDDTFRRFVPAGRIELGGAREAAEAFVGHPVASPAPVSLPGRLEREAGRDPGRRAQSGRGLLAPRAPAGGRLHHLRLDPRRQGRRPDARAVSPRSGRRFVATDPRTRARSPRPISPSALGRTSPTSRVVADPTAAVDRAHALGEPVLVTGSLYLLADLEAAARR